MREHMLVGLPLYYLRPRALGTAPGPGICASFQNGNTEASDRGTVGSPVTRREFEV